VKNELAAAGRALAAEGLVTAFGHVSARAGSETALITPPRPLGSLGDDDPLLGLSLAEEELPVGVPGEAWIHWAIYRARADVDAVCRAQPPAAAAFGVTATPIRALHGQGAFLGEEVPVHEDARLVRSKELGLQVAERLGGGSTVLLRGNGAVTVGATVGEAVARMWVLEASARLNLEAATLPSAPRPLSAEELAAWAEVAPEILQRIWHYLTREEPT
jgi:HCOMODA/2-hydroxy-3-carboxy-muconic semialdehyde decarboxylase